MADIKTKKPQSKTIKVLKKSVAVAEKFKDVAVDVKNTTDKGVSSDNIYDYGGSQIENYSKATAKGTYQLTNKIGKHSIIKTKQNYKKLKKQITRFKENRKKSKIMKAAKSNLKKGKVGIQKTAKYSKAVVRNTKKTSYLTRHILKKAVIAIFNTIKSVVVVSKALITALISLGFVSIIVIIVVAVVALICSSAYGVFFSNEVNQGDYTINKVVMELNEEVNNKILTIQNENPHEDYEIVSNMSKWEELLAIYASKLSNGQMKYDVITLDESKVKTLKDLFWQMNSITFSVSDKKMLTIKISSKSLEEMMNLNNFTKEQRIQVNELLDKKFSSIWTDVIYGKSVGNKDIVKLAEKQIGNIGGQKFWSWYGFNSRVEWCAIFVSWLANETGYLNKAIPKFSSCQNQGVVWFKSMSLWHNRGFVPKEGDIIFFDWENDGHSDHVGIVEKVSGGKVYTIEGNSNNRVQKQSYKLNSKVIYGYGTPQY